MINQQTNQYLEIIKEVRLFPMLKSFLYLIKWMKLKGNKCKVRFYLFLTYKKIRKIPYAKSTNNIKNISLLDTQLFTYFIKF